MHHPPFHIFEFTPETLAEWCQARGLPKFRADQILEWVYAKGVADPARMSNLSKLDRDLLAREMTFLSGEIVRRQSASDGTLKLLIQWQDGSSPTGFPTPSAPTNAAPTPTSAADAIASLPQLGVAPTPSADPAGAFVSDSSRQTECVMIPTDDRRTACISSQIGCPVGCRFCASGLGGLDGNLSAGRIVEQVWRLRQALIDAQPASDAKAGKLPRITNVVFMGMGEPLANLAAVVPAIRTITSLWGMAISARKVTVSTVGLPKAIQKLGEQLDLPVTLALSLHAPNDEIRRQLIPWAEYTTIDELLAACQAWFTKTGREITLEYTLLRGVNDRPEHATQLAALSKKLRANVNLIRYNEVAGLPFKRPRQEDVLVFQGLLREKNVNAHIRASRGRDIAAACGQLRHEAKDAGAPVVATAISTDAAARAS